MATLLSPNQIKLNDGKTISPQQGAWYDGRRYLDGQLLSAGEYEPGKMTSNEVIAQTNQKNVGYIQQQVKADTIQAPVQIPYSSGPSLSSGLMADVQKYRTSLDNTLNTRKIEIDTKLADLRKKEQDAVGEIGKLTTPFREELENTERERLYINKNFEENQQLVDELDQLLTEGNNLIRQQQEVTGLAAVRNPRIQKTMDDVNARAGVIQAVISARNGQIAQAQTFIDRSIGAIAADRQDQISYYETIINLNNRDILSLDADSKQIAEEQLNLKKLDLENAQATANYVKQLLLDPATAGLMGQAGVKLTDSVESINSKLVTAQFSNELREQANEIALKGGVPIVDPSSVPANQLVSFTDSRGQKHYYKMPATGGSGSALADNLIAEEVSRRLGVNTDSVNDSNIVSDILELGNQVIAPSFTPSMMGAIYTDSLGRQWQFTSQGWILLS